MFAKPLIIPKVISPRDIADEVSNRLAILSASTGKGGSKAAEFSKFYLFTTRNWIRQTRGQPGEDFVGLLIGNFFHLYEIYALDPILGGRPSAAPHWRVYLDLARTRDTTRPYGAILSALRLVRAARAHVRHDLSQAILKTCHQYHLIFGINPEPDEIGHLILGPQTDKIFSRAAREFHIFCQADNSASPFTRFLANHPRLWLPLLQSWRNQAWEDARAVLQKDARPPHPG